MRDIRHTPFGTRHSWAAVIAEMILVMPFLVVVLALLLLFGRDMVRVQRTQVMDRYEAWRQVGRGPGPGDDPDQMNLMFYAGNAETVITDAAAHAPSDAGRRLADATVSFGFETGELARQLLADLPKGRRVSVTVRHENRIRLFEPFEGPIRHRHTRLEHEWRHANGWRNIEGRRWRSTSRDGRWESGDPVSDGGWGLTWQAWPEHGHWHPDGPNASNLPPLREVFFGDFEHHLGTLGDTEAGPMASMMRRLYLSNPPYFGPSVGFE